jgi:hypothetical protein
VNTDDPTWQERKAESFTVSPLHSGNWRLGYRDTREYGGTRGITLGTAVTISGAAVSPNMGYHSSKVIAFLLTLFNVRLGWWLGNPGPAGERTYKRPCPRLTITPLAAEAFGFTDDHHGYVYLSDGGHFENLGLYEMVRRRCHQIVVCDAGCDPGCALDDLGNAVRKIRIDMGVRIKFTRILISGRRNADGRNADGRCETPPRDRYCAIGEIDYRSVDGEQARNGTLLYIKPAYYGGEPADVVNYATTCRDFPHETTADQFFSESQFESYRSLGYHVMEQLWGSTRLTGAADLDELFDRAAANVAAATAPPPRQTGGVRNGSARSGGFSTIALSGARGGRAPQCTE